MAPNSQQGVLKISFSAVSLSQTEAAAKGVNPIQHYPAYTLGGLTAQMAGISADLAIESNVLVRKWNFPVNVAMLSGEADLRNTEDGTPP